MYKTYSIIALILIAIFIITSCQESENDLIRYNEVSFTEDIQYLLHERLIDTLLFHRLKIFQKFDKKRIGKDDSMLEVVNKMNLRNPLSGISYKAVRMRKDGKFTLIKKVETDSINYEFTFDNKTEQKPTKFEIKIHIYDIMGDLAVTYRVENNFPPSSKQSIKVGLKDIVPLYYSNEKKKYLIEQIGTYDLLKYSRFNLKSVKIIYENGSAVEE